MLLCIKTIRTAAYLTTLVLSTLRLSKTYAAVPAKVSKGFATLALDNIARNNAVNAVIIINFVSGECTTSRIHIGAINTMYPEVVITMVTKASTL